MLLKVIPNTVVKILGSAKVVIGETSNGASEQVVNYNFKGDFDGRSYSLGDAVVTLGRSFETNMNSRALYLYINATCAPGSSPYSSDYYHCWSLITDLPDYNPADPLNSLEDDEAAVKIDGWYIDGQPVGGQSWRILNPTSLVNGRPAYTYGDETLYWDGSNWIYSNSGFGTLSTGTGNAPYPWQATWSGGFTSVKSILR
jgi:hypothetical protein